MHILTYDIQLWEQPIIQIYIQNSNSSIHNSLYNHKCLIQYLKLHILYQIKNKHTRRNSIITVQFRFRTTNHTNSLRSLLNPDAIPGNRSRWLVKKKRCRDLILWKKTKNKKLIKTKQKSVAIGWLIFITCLMSTTLSAYVLIVIIESQIIVCF